MRTGSNPLGTLLHCVPTSRPQPARSSLAGPRRVLPTFFQHLMPVFHFSYCKRNDQPYS